MSSPDTKGLSAPATTRAVIELLAELDWSRARVADVGAGRGHLCAVLGGWLRERHGLDPRDHLLPCDTHPETFQAPGIVCARAVPGRPLPYADASCDAVVSIEVIEHVEDQFAFLRELARIARPGAPVVVTTPNVLSLTSRVRTLLCGFPELFDPLLWRDGDERLLSGHIHPIHPYFLGLGALRAGLAEPCLFPDRRKRSALLWAVVLAPALLLARTAHAAHLARRSPDVLAQNRSLLDALNGLDMLTARTAILRARKPAER